MRMTAVAVCCLGLVLGAARPASADPVYIKGGYYVVEQAQHSYQFRIPSPFDPGYVVLVTGSAPTVPGINYFSCLICAPGERYEIGRQTDGPGFLGKADLGTSTVAFGSVVDDYALSGWLTFLADPITLPAAGSSSASFAVPFRARVSLDGQELDGSGGGFFSRWIGTGTAHVTFTPTADGRWANATGELLRFEFSTDPVPEPATLFLMATGLAGIAAARRRPR
jgi:hypothetical protein